MIRWTAQGVVAYPRAVQIRLTLHHPKRIPGRAPTPSRSMTEQELLTNVHYFTTGLNTPRARPCTTLILTGLEEQHFAQIDSLHVLLHNLGITTLILHIGTELLPLLNATTSDSRLNLRHVCSIKNMGDLDIFFKNRLPNSEVSIMLAEELLEQWPKVIHQIQSAQLDIVSFHYPYPSGAELPHHTVVEIREKLGSLQQAVPNLRLQVKGLPVCYLYPLDLPHRQTSNRWYVDADNQTDQALLFLPDVLQFHKSDGCRFCSQDGLCDGFFLRHLQKRPFPPLQDPQLSHN